MRLRLGSYVIGINSNLTQHALFGRFMIGRVADTIGVLNTIKGHKEQMLFADFDKSQKDMYDDIKRIREKHILGDIYVFMSESPNQEAHYFMISPCYYSPDEIRIILAEMKNVDGKFTAVYMRDGVNAIRLIPKQIGKKQSRFISIIDGIPSNEHWCGQRQYVRGMMILLHNTFKDQFSKNNIELNPDDEVGEDLDISELTDLTLREYETIRW